MLRQLSIASIWFVSAMPTGLGFRRFRWTGYGMSAVSSVPIFKRLSYLFVWPFRDTGAAVRFFVSIFNFVFSTAISLIRFFGECAALGCFREGGRPGNPMPSHSPFDHFLYIHTYSLHTLKNFLLYPISIITLFHGKRTFPITNIRNKTDLYSCVSRFSTANTIPSFNTATTDECTMSRKPTCRQLIFKEETYCVFLHLTDYRITSGIRTFILFTP